MSSDAVTRTGRASWTRALLALLVVAAALGAFLVFDELTDLRAAPPIEEVAVERVILHEGEVELHLRNDGPDPVRIAQLLINDAYWNFEIGDSQLDRLRSTRLRTDYPWEEGLPLNLTLVTSTGVTIEHEIEAAAATPGTTGETFLTYALLGLYIGVIPVGIGLFALPFIRRMSRAWLGFFLALTVGLLAFLLVDTAAEGLELAAATGEALDGVALFAIGGLLTVGALVWFQGRLGQPQSAGLTGLPLSYLIATGIGLHNLGEGLAVGAALAVGEVALGTFLVAGLALHNTTEGLAIVAPLGRKEGRVPLRHLVALGAIAGAPTIPGAWIGGFAFSPAWGALAFGAAAGAIGQVIWTVVSSMRGEAAISRGLPAIGFAAGLLVMYVTGLFIA